MSMHSYRMRLASRLASRRATPAPGAMSGWGPFIFAALCLVASYTVGHASAAEALRIGVLVNSPPMSWRTDDGEYKGYSIDMIREVCSDLKWNCTLVPTTLADSIADLRSDRIDIAGMSLLPTAERKAQILLARPFYTSFSVWLAKPGARLDAPGTRVAVVPGSAQAEFAKARGWNVVEIPDNRDLGKAILTGKADGMLAPMMTVLGFRSDPAIQAMNLVVQPMREPELTGATSFGISPNKPWVKEKVDGALERLERSGVYDRINSRYVPFRVN